MGLLIDSLIVMQDTLRDAGQIEGMIRYVKEGGLWSNESFLKSYSADNNRIWQPVYIARFPDGVLMIHDGHHRILATYLAGRSELLDAEYWLCDWTYEAYNSIFFDRGYVTPHDPRVEVRLNDFLGFKKEAIALAATDKEAAIQFIYQNKHRYARPREIHTVAELAARYRSTVEIEAA